MSARLPDDNAAGVKPQLLEWLEPVVAEGWIPQEEVDSLQALESTGAERLFDTQTGRPLTVGLFGGTGVGKSSLLNRLVGEPVAEVGLERPTSTEVTLYVHEQYPLKDFPEEFPVERVRVVTHHRDAYRDVVWIDMPDIDSVEERNRALVFEWLPCIDWLVYVVSPEKYRDDAGWRVLRQRGHRHHWLFVINRWDTGTEPQHADFERLLLEAGVPDPVVLRTSCTAPGNDDFDAVAGTIDRAVAAHGLAQLQQVGERARLADLRQRCERYADLLGEPPRWRRFIERARTAVDGKLAALQEYLREEAVIQAAGVPDRQSDEAAAGFEPAVPGLIADHARDLESAVAIEADELPAAPIRAATRSVTGSLNERAAEVFRSGFRQGLARPGNALQRTLAAWMGKLVYGLPLLTGAGMGYVVFSRYQAGLGGSAPFLGFDFLAHSLMVLGLAALLPYLLARLLRPSVRRAIVRRVQDGAGDLRRDVTGEWQAAMEALAERAEKLNGQLDVIRAATEGRSRPGGP